MRPDENYDFSKQGRIHQRILLASLVLLIVFASELVLLPQAQRTAPPATPGPMLKDGTVNFETPEFNLTLVRDSQTVAALKPKGTDNFDFTPGDLLVERSQDGFYHLGDLDLRLRTGSAGDWKAYSTAFARAPVTALPSAPGILAAADLTPTLPADIPMQIKLHSLLKWVRSASR